MQWFIGRHFNKLIKEEFDKREQMEYGDNNTISHQSEDTSFKWRRCSVGKTITKTYANTNPNHQCPPETS